MTAVASHGLHHVTAIADDPQRNVDFYSHVLGLRLVTQTVNVDAPDTCHLYYGDEAGRPSSLLTFFPWKGMARGGQGTGLATATAFPVPEASLGWWHGRLLARGVDVDAPRARNGEEVLTLRAIRTAWSSSSSPPRATFAAAGTGSGFDIDEPLLALGRSLRLPPWLEPSREQIAAALPPLRLDEAQAA